MVSVIEVELLPVGLYYLGRVLYVALGLIAGIGAR